MRSYQFISEKAVSKKQQQFFGIVRAMQKGDIPKDGEAGKVAKDMKKSDVKDFAKTKHKGLPTRKKNKESKTIKVDHTAVMDSANAGYVLVQDRKCIARGSKEEMLKLHEETPQSRVWVSTAEVDQLVESENAFQHLMREYIAEGWSKKYKDSINCSNPKGFSQKAHCAGRKKKESIEENVAKVEFDDGKTRHIRTYGKTTNKQIVDYYKNKGLIVKSIDGNSNLDEGDIGVTAGALRGTVIDLISDKIQQTDDVEKLKYWLKMIVGRTIKPRGEKRYTITDEDVRQALTQVKENFADGKKKGKSRPGRVKRAGASCNGSVTDLRKKAKNASGEKAKMYHWCANMKSGRKKG